MYFICEVQFNSIYEFFFLFAPKTINLPSTYHVHVIFKSVQKY